MPNRIRIVAAGLALVLLLFSRGCLGQVPSPTDLIFQWYPWSETKPEGYLTPKNPLLYDGAVQVYPWYLFARGEIREGRLPLWNPYSGCGVPHAANPVTAVFSPFSLPIWFLPFPLAMLIVHAAKVFLAWTSMALYLRHRGMGTRETLIGAAAFALSGYVILWLFWHHSSTFLWLPLLFLLSERVVDGDRRRDLALLALAGGLCVLSGHVETAFHNAAALIAWSAGRIAWRLIRRRSRPGEAGRAVIRLAVAAAIAVGISAIVTLPFLEYLGESHALRIRDAVADHPFYLRPNRALALLVPNFFGDPGRGLNWFPEGTYIEAGQGYFGVIPFALFLMGLYLAVRRRDPGGIGLGAIALLSLAVSYGIPPFYQLLTSLPGFRVSLNFRMLSLAAFAGIVLGAGTLKRILAGRPEDRTDLAAGAIFAGGAIAILLVALPFAAARRPGVAGSDVPPLSLSSLGPRGWIGVHILLAAALTAGFLLLLALRLRGRLSAGRFGWIVAALVLGDLIWFAYRFNPMIPPGQIYPPTAATDFLARAGESPFRTLGTPTHLRVGTNIPYRIEDVRGYDALGIARYEDVRQVLSAGATPNEQDEIWNGPLLDLMNVRYLVRPFPGEHRGAWPVQNDRPGGEILPSSPIGQTFTVPTDGLYGVAFLFGTYRRVNRGTLRFHLLVDGPGGAERAVVDLEMAGIDDNRWRLISFPPIRDSAGRRYYAYLESPDAAPGNAVTIWLARSDAYAGGSLFRFHGPAEGEDACIRAYTEAALRVTPKVEGLSLYENPRVLPRAFLVRRVRPSKSGAETIQWMREGKIDFRSEVVLEDPSGLPPGLVEPRPEGAGEGTVRIVSHLPNEVRIRIEGNPAPAILVMSDTFYPGWRATLGGEEIPILRANHAFRAVPVPAGSHDLAFRFASPRTRWGAATSILALLLATAMLIRGEPAGSPGGSPRESGRIRGRR